MVWSCPPISTSAFCWEVLNFRISHISNLRRSSSSGSYPGQLCSQPAHAHFIQELLYSWLFYKLTKNPLSLTACVLHFSWGILSILPVYVLNIKHVELKARAAEHFKAESAFCGGWQNSQMAPTGQRTIPPADAPKATGLEHSFLLHPPSPPHPPSSLPSFISEKKHTLRGSLAHLHLVFCVLATSISLSSPSLAYVYSLYNKHNWRHAAKKFPTLD